MFVAMVSARFVTRLEMMLVTGTTLGIQFADVFRYPCRHPRPLSMFLTVTDLLRVQRGLSNQYTQTLQDTHLQASWITSP